MKLSLILLLLIFSIGLSAKENHPRSASKIIKRIDKLLINNCCTPGKKDFKAYLKEKGISYPVDEAIFRVFKRDKIMEIWAKDSEMKKLIKVMVVPICAMDFEPNTKFKRGDGKTPEGFYHGNIMYGSSNFFMWMKLNEKEIDEYGVVQDGSSFKICIDYPNNLDRWKSKMNGINTGGAICIHGNCVSAGCVSFLNRNFLPVFAFAKHHNSKKYGKLQYHIFPFDFSKVKDLKKEAEKYSKDSYFTQEQLYAFWLNLKEGYDYFNKEKRAIKWSVKKLTFRVNNRYPEIKVIKQILLKKKLFKGKIDEEFTKELEISIKKFQKINYLTSDGVIGMKTLHKLGYIYGVYSFR